jgi:peptidoglycan/LPS O-acetylase OafA/YrhL
VAREPQLDALTGVRFLAAFAVFNPHPILSWPQFYLLSVVASIAISVVVQRFYERPLRTFIRGRLFRFVGNSPKFEPIGAKA